LGVHCAGIVYGGVNFTVGVVFVYRYSVGTYTVLECAVQTYRKHSMHNIYCIDLKSLKFI